MKKLMQLTLLLAMASFISSCGKENASGAGVTSAAAPVVPCTDINYNGVCDSDEGLENAVTGDYAGLKHSLETKEFSDGIANNTVVYHEGTFFGAPAQQQTLNFEFRAVLCIGSENLLGNDDYCQGSDLSDYYNNGEYKLVKSSDSEGNNYSLATGINSYGYINYQNNLRFDQNTEQYRKILNKDELALSKVVVSSANIQFNNEEKKGAELIEYFFSDGRYEAYLVSRDLPLIANPIAVLEGYSSGYGTNFGLTGLLRNIGDKNIRAIEMTTHRLYQNYQTGQLEVVDGSPVNIY